MATPTRKVGDPFTLPRGTQVGLGKLKADVEGQGVKVDGANGHTVYLIKFFDKNKARFTWANEEQDNVC